jgi:hypothetical protein
MTDFVFFMFVHVCTKCTFSSHHVIALLLYFCCSWLLGNRVRFHYGHPDIFDRLFHITRGGISKASKTINLSEDIFSGTCISWKQLVLVP